MALLETKELNQEEMRKGCEDSNLAKLPQEEGAPLEPVLEISNSGESQSSDDPAGMDSESTQSEEAAILDLLVSPKV